MFRQPFNKINNLAGWAIFAIALTTYLLTMEPTASYWDCPEYIAGAYAMEPGHAPGNPIFMLTARLLINFAPTPQHAAAMVGAMSGLLSALTAMLLFWTISLIIRIARPDTVAAATICASAVGALALTWSDTFWFSATEAEVYAYSIFCTALAVWLMLKWWVRADKPHSDRYLLLIVYVMGVSIGIHLLNLLCIPALALMFTARKHQTLTLKNSLVATLTGFAIVGAILFLLIPLAIRVCCDVELWAVNTLGLPYNTGTIAAAALMLLLPLAALAVMERLNINPHCRRIVGVILWSLPLLLIGFSSYAVTIIRAAAAPPMNEGNPDNIFAFKSYFNRDQYGSHPLFYGPTPYSQPVARELTVTDSEGHRQYNYDQQVYIDKGPVYGKSDSPTADRYVVKSHRRQKMTTPELNMFMPRIFSSDASHLRSYESWAGASASTMDSIEVTTAIDSTGRHINRCNPLTGQRPVQRLPRPTILQNLKFLFGYQIGYMYMRYFMWNFAGRQNDIQSQGQADSGNFITGFDALDNAMLGAQSHLPAELKDDNPGYNRYFLLPLLLGITGCISLYRQNRRSKALFWSIAMLWFMTGIAIVIYLNQTPNEVRERDYSFVGSFYAFAIFIGIGAAWLHTTLGRLLRRHTTIASLTAAATLAVPLQMLSQNCDDHNRSHRTAARDFAYNILQTMEPDAILFTNGDNQTFPLWYLQETEGVRTDVRVVNLAYLATSWYKEQMMMPARESQPLPIAADPHTAIKKCDPALPIIQSLDSLLHSAALANSRSAMLAIVVNTMAQNSRRPIYWFSNLGNDSYIGLKPYFTQIGQLYRLTPKRNESLPFDADKTYTLATQQWLYGGADKGAYFDNTAGDMLSLQRRALIKTAQTLTDRKQYDKALQIIRLCLQKLPESAYPYKNYTENHITDNEALALARTLTAIARATGNAALHLQALNMIDRQVKRSAQFVRYKSALPPSMRSYLSIETLSLTSTFYNTIHTYRLCGGDTARLTVRCRLQNFPLRQMQQNFMLNLKQLPTAQ